VFSIVGHFIEIIWAWMKYFAVGSTWYPRVDDLIPLAAPYGLGTILLIIIVWPIMKSRKIHPFSIFVLSGVLAGIVETISALFVILLYGQNYFWDYSNRFMNFFGLTCLRACFLFSIVSVIFLYFIYPQFEKLFEKFGKRRISIIFWVLFVIYVGNLILSFI
jgi:uncharacterized membrane protein